MEREVVQPAGTTYTDWVGSAAAEDSVLEVSGDLYVLAGLEPAKWSILAVDLYAFSHGSTPAWHVDVYALDRQSNSVNSFDDMQALQASRGSLPVVHVRLHGVGIDDVVRCMKLVRFQLIKPDFSNLDVVERTDFPPQE